jgi:phosphoenolpyruvate carboxykinase (GTP)
VWPGFGENMRLLKWIIQRVHGKASAVESPIGWMPHYNDIDWKGLDKFTKKEFDELMTIDREAWKQELLSHAELFERMYDKLPKEYIFLRELMLSSLWRSAAHGSLSPKRFKYFPISRLLSIVS